MLLEYADINSTMTNLKGRTVHLDDFRKGYTNPKINGCDSLREHRQT